MRQSILLTYLSVQYEAKTKKKIHNLHADVQLISDLYRFWLVDSVIPSDRARLAFSPYFQSLR